MHSYNKVFIAGVFLFISSNSSVFADGVFTDRSRDRHGLSAGEQRQITLEFLKRFGRPVSPAPVRTNNPWEAKKQRQQAQRSITWGECRDYALQMRNLCYKRGQDAYNCERFYEARSRKCDADY